MSHRRARLVLLALLALLFWPPRPVKGQDLSGTWRSEVPIRISSSNGLEQVEQTATLLLTFEQRGDSVVAHWQMTAPDGDQPPPRMLRGVVRDGTVVLTDTSEATIQRNDEPPVLTTMVSTMEFTVTGDDLVGTRTGRSVDGAVTMTPRRFTARRESR